MLLPSAQSFSSVGHRKAKRAGTDSKAGVGSAFISAEKKTRSKVCCRCSGQSLRKVKEKEENPVKCQEYDLRVRWQQVLCSVLPSGQISEAFDTLLSFPPTH